MYLTENQALHVAVTGLFAYRLAMASYDQKTDLPIRVQALKNMLTDVERLLTTTVPLPENRTARCLELLSAARELADGLLRVPGKGVPMH